MVNEIMELKAELKETKLEKKKMFDENNEMVVNIRRITEAQQASDDRTAQIQNEFKELEKVDLELNNSKKKAITKEARLAAANQELEKQKHEVMEKNA